MLPEPSIWRTYHSPRVSPSIEVFSNDVRLLNLESFHADYQTDVPVSAD